VENLTLGNVTVGDGDVAFELRVVGQQAESTGHRLSVDYVQLCTCFYIPPLADIFREAESANPASSDPIYTDPAAGASGGFYVYLDSAGDGSSVTFTVPDVQAGTYDLEIGYGTFTDQGIFQVYYDGNPVGSAVDSYSASLTFTNANVGALTAPGGDLDLELRADGKNAASSWYRLAIDYLNLLAN
jgi:hypothetical protein